MKAIEYVKEHDDYNVGYAMAGSFRAGFLAAKHEQEINRFDEAFPDKVLVISSTGIELNHATRKELMAFLTAFRGNWQKEVEEYYPDKMRYFQKITNGDFSYELKAGCVPPPPSCKIVEEEVDVPARKEIKKRIVCKEPTLDPVEELAAEVVEEAPAV
jgi:hypothetical protein